MEVSVSKMSANGQIVIPREIRKEAGIGPATKFIVFTKGKNIMLKPIRKEKLAEEIDLLEKIARSEEQIIKGKYTEANTSMSEEEIDALLRDEKH